MNIKEFPINIGDKMLCKHDVKYFDENYDFLIFKGVVTYTVIDFPDRETMEECGEMFTCEPNSQTKEYWQTTEEVVDNFYTGIKTRKLKLKTIL